MPPGCSRRLLEGTMTIYSPLNGAVRPTNASHGAQPSSRRIFTGWNVPTNKVVFRQMQG